MVDLRTYKENQRVAALLCGLFLVFVTVLGAVTRSYAEGEESTRTVTVTARREGENLWTVTVSPSLAELAKGRVMALLLCLELPKGHYPDQIQAGEGAAGLTLTVGEVREGCVSVLFDGIPTEEETVKTVKTVKTAETAETTETAETAILRINSVQDPKEPGKQEGFMGITGGKYGELAIFCQNREGNVEKIPLTVGVCTDQESDFVHTETESRPKESEALSDGTEEGIVSEEETLPPFEEDAEDQPVFNRFVGCRETCARDGIFTVQFLFFGKGKDTPVVCAEGRGSLWLEVQYRRPPPPPAVDASCAEGNTREALWSTCTFQGLSETERYVFWVYTKEKTVQVIYEKGKFRGYI